jgi:hypothetical protein
VRAGTTHSDGIDNTQAQRSTLETVSHGQDRVGRFTRLRDEDSDIVSEDGRAAVQEIRRYLSALALQ